MNIWLHMAHPADGEWRAYLDGEVSEVRHQALDRHLQQCVRCRARLTELQTTAGVAAARLGALRAVAEIAPVPPMPSRPRPVTPLPKEESPMTGSRSTSRIAAVAVAAAMAVSLFFPGVRAAAADFITVFRVKEAKVIRINPADFQQIGSADMSSFAGLSPAMLEGLIQVEAPALTPPQQEELTLDDLTRRGFKAPTWLPEGYTPTTGAYFAPQETKIQVDVDRVNELLGLIGSKERLPRELKGQTITFSIGATLIMGYRDHQAGANLTVTRGDAPSVSVTGGADVGKALAVLMAVIAEQPQLPESLRTQLKGLDLTRTLPLPVVEGVNQEVKVKGKAGIFTPMQPGGGILVWLDNGVTHTISAFSGSTSLSADDLLRIAESLER